MTKSWSIAGSCRQQARIELKVLKPGVRSAARAPGPRCTDPRTRAVAPRYAPMVFGIIPECRSASLRNKRSASPESPVQSRTFSPREVSMCSVKVSMSKMERSRSSTISDLSNSTLTSNR